MQQLEWRCVPPHSWLADVATPGFILDVFPSSSPAASMEKFLVVALKELELAGYGLEQFRKVGAGLAT